MMVRYTNRYRQLTEFNMKYMDLLTNNHLN